MRVVDIDNLKDKLGALTNFGIKVLMTDNVNKINTKRLLLENALEEINRRLLVMAGMEEVETEVIWAEFIPINEMEQAQYYQMLLNMGVISKQTVAEKVGLDWEQEQERMKDEQQQNQDIGSFLLRSFNRGEGGANLPTMPNPQMMRGNEQPPGNGRQPVEQ
jgi:hypothetical protein